jgi:RHH-type transcriptional regulator, proline utilization regulon repressor / proline dehydrogenase / delta 1-pyrroline-5-carboxylate dehydrogenase
MNQRVLPRFVNEAPLDFSLLEVHEQFSRSLEALNTKIRSGLHYGPFSCGTWKEGSRSVPSLNPSSEEVLGYVSDASEEDVDATIRFLAQNAVSWSETPLRVRTTIIRNLAQKLREERYALAALIVLEVGKPWKEADADVIEAIDFCEYYADSAEFFGGYQPTSDMPGERNIYFYQPRGLCVVISPWNFPLAIACGMLVASLVCGNCTIFKPAEQASLVGARLSELLLESGIPSSAFAFLPGPGETVGEVLVSSSQVHLICFTGSRPVGLSIIEKAYRTLPGQRHIKRVIAELGGKNAIIIDEDADIDESIKGILYSAFGYAGQKCSAASRLIVVGELYEHLLQRLSHALQDLIVAPADLPSTFVGPVIDKEAHSRLMSLLQLGVSQGHIVAQTPLSYSKGYFIAPTLFKDVDLNSSLWNDELFGPLLSTIKATSFDQALDLAHESDYALTGGVYSRSPRSIEKAISSFRVGNLYINRPCTGAIVGRQPFGGFRLSGIGSKAGGPDYLLQFMEPRVVSENTTRRGFVPEL